MKHTRTRLPSGLTVITIPIQAIESVTVLALVNAGSRYEQKKWWGISHFLEHMVFKGTEKYADAQTLASTVDAIGARFNAFTSKEYTGYYVKSASTHFALALDVVSDMLLTPRLRQSDIDREKGVIIEEMNMYSDMPARNIANLFEEMVFTMDTVGHDVIGTKKSISALKTEDFQAYLDTWYGLSNVTVILAGDARVLKGPGLQSTIKKAFTKGDVQKRRAEQAADHFGPNPLTKNRLLVEYKKTEQAHFIMSFPGFTRNDPDRFAAALLSVVLGGNMSSRLFSEVREKRGLCYYVHSDFDSYHDVGLFGASAGVDPKRVDEAIQVTLDEFFAVRDGRKPITTKELQMAKDYIQGQFILDLEDSENVAQYFGMKYLLQGKIETPEELLAKYAAVTLQDIQRVVQRLIVPDQVRFGIIGPFKTKKGEPDRARFSKILGM